MTKSNKQINKEAGMAPDTENTPAVIAYRMGKVEEAVDKAAIAVTEGFKAHDKKLDTLTSNFATKEELGVIQKRIDDYQWYFRALVVAVLTALAGLILTWMHGK